MKEMVKRTAVVTLAGVMEQTSRLELSAFMPVNSSSRLLPCI